MIYLLEKPTREVWPIVYQIRDEAAVSDIVAALRASTVMLFIVILVKNQQLSINVRNRIKYKKRNEKDGSISEEYY